MDAFDLHCEYLGWKVRDLDTKSKPIFFALSSLRLLTLVNSELSNDYSALQDLWGDAWTLITTHPQQSEAKAKQILEAIDNLIPHSDDADDAWLTQGAYIMMDSAVRSYIDPTRPSENRVQYGLEPIRSAYLVSHDGVLWTPDAKKMEAACESPAFCREFENMKRDVISLLKSGPPSPSECEVLRKRSLDEQWTRARLGLA